MREPEIGSTRPARVTDVRFANSSWFSYIRRHTRTRLLSRAYRTGSSLSSSFFFSCPAYTPVLPSHEKEPDRVYCGAWESAGLYCAVDPSSTRPDDDFRSTWFRARWTGISGEFFARRNERSLLGSVVKEEMVERKRNELAWARGALRTH